MKVLHIAGGDISVGAVKGAFALHEALMKRGIDSRILMNSDSSIVDGIVDLRIHQTESRKERALIESYSNRQFLFLSSGIAGDNKPIQDHLDWSDVIHIHWVGFGQLDLLEVFNSHKPIIITLRDMWFFTGLCSYSFDCNRYKEQCGNCPQLNSGINLDLSSYAQQRKYLIYQRASSALSFTSISQWLALEASTSSIMKDFSVTIIPNAIDINAFRPLGRKEARKKLGIIEQKVVLFLAASIKSRRKGFDLFVSAMELCSAHEAAVLVVGKGSDAIDQSNPSLANAYTVPFINNDRELSVFYSCADVLVVPSEQEAFGKTVIEALSCGTPVVAFDIGGPSEILTHLEDGYLARPFSVTDLAAGIDWALGEADSPYRRTICREKAISKYSVDVIAEVYVELYGEMHASAPVAYQESKDGTTQLIEGGLLETLRGILTSEPSLDVEEFRDRFRSRFSVVFDDWCRTEKLHDLTNLHALWLWSVALLKEQPALAMAVMLERRSNWGMQTFRELEQIMLDFYWLRRLHEVIDRDDEDSIRQCLVRATERSRKIALFGAGEFGKAVFSRITNMDFSIEKFVDNDKHKWGILQFGVEVVSPQYLTSDFFTVICSSWRLEIEQQLISIGLKKYRDFIGLG